jgi:hydrogenase assembly chaperone HypC/HupF
MKIIKIKGKKAVVESGDHNHVIDLNLIKDPKIGDYILAHGDMAINKVPQEEAKKIFKIINDKK